MAGRAFSPLEDTWVSVPYHSSRPGASTGLHEGTDFRAATGTIVRAPRDSLVVFTLRPEESGPRSGWYGYGGVVGLFHPEDRLFTMYAHLSRVLVSRGMHIPAGTMVALTGHESGNPPKFPGMPPHLHMETRHMIGRPPRIPFPARYGSSTEDSEEFLARFGIRYGHNASRRVQIVRGSVSDPRTWA